jgi:hypothetical protein
LLGSWVSHCSTDSSCAGGRQAAAHSAQSVHGVPVAYGTLSSSERAISWTVIQRGEWLSQSSHWGWVTEPLAILMSTHFKASQGFCLVQLFPPLNLILISLIFQIRTSNSLSFCFLLLLCWLGVHCNIYKSS